MRPSTSPLLKISGNIPLRNGRQWEVPNLKVLGVEGSQSWVILAQNLQQKNFQGISQETVTETKWKELPNFHKVIDPTDSVWRITEPKWNLQVQVKPTQPKPSCRILMGEQKAAVGDGNRWLHQILCLVEAKQPADLSVRIPRGAKILAVEVNGESLKPTRISSRDIQIPFAASIHPHWLVIRWQYFHHSETFSKPRLESLGFSPACKEPMLLEIQIPSGYRYRITSEDKDWNPTSTAAADVVRAKQQLKIWNQIARGLSKNDPQLNNRVMPFVQNFYGFLSRAQRRSQLEQLWGKIDSEQKEKIQKEVQQLQRKANSLAKQMEIKTRQQQAEKHPAIQPLWFKSISPLPQAGTPRVWEISQRSSPPIKLESIANYQGIRKLWITQLLAILLIAIWVLSFIPGAAAILQHAWPEMLMLFAWLGFQLFGLSLIGLFLVLIAVGSRLLLLIFHVVRFFKRRRVVSQPS